MVMLRVSFNCPETVYKKRVKTSYWTTVAVLILAMHHVI